MKAPDKIYIPNLIDTVSRIILTTTTAPDDIEYIRKDALLEWAKEKKAELLDGELTDVAAGINMGMDMLINKLETL